MTTATRKISYTVPCASSFRDAVMQLAERRQSNVADLARSALLLLPEDVLRQIPDPGEPAAGDREQTVLKSGPSAGRPWRRKPRLQVRLPAGYAVPTVRRALNLLLFLSRNEREIDIHDPAQAKQQQHSQDHAFAEEIERLQTIVSVLSFNPLTGGVRSRMDALHVLGFAPSSRPNRSEIRARFRALAAVHHPDGNYGDHQRMSQLNAAMEILGSGL
ncbi:MAG: J domain-containing protein [Rhodospirillaceae bacterium]|nr:J domain-containing protein [Rhodospirillaceae bacterium]MBT4673448.1 J domain-containing protein [Rhodospirillaceae bacterium]MBT5838369.1 J domain-containing protein [Rhodospirillaceae bacterium]